MINANYNPNLCDTSTYVRKKIMIFNNFNANLCEIYA